MSILRGTCYATISIIYSVCYIFSWKTGKIVTFAQFEEGYLVENECNAEEDESILDSIYKSYTDNYSNEISIITNAIEGIWNISQIHP